LSKAERESKDEKLRRYPRVSRNAGKLAAAVRVLSGASAPSPSTRLPRHRRLIPESARREGSSRQVVSDVTADKGSLSAVNP